MLTNYGNIISYGLQYVLPSVLLNYNGLKYDFKDTVYENILMIFP